MKRIHVRTILIIACALALFGTACNRLYQLPDPAPRADWRRHSLSPAEDAERSREYFVDAEAAVQAFVAAMDSGDYAGAYEHLSNETRILLDDLSPEGRGESVLENGLITRDGNEHEVDALDLLAVRGMVSVEDTHENRPESETYRRKEVYAVGFGGAVHHVVLILEQDEWRIHKPDIDLAEGAPGRRNIDG